MILRISFIIICGIILPLRAEEVFVYDDHGKRDPFAPLVNPNGAVVVYDTDLSLADLNLEGIVADTGGNNIAIINGKIVKVSDKVGPYVVVSIAVDHVKLSKEEEYFTLKLKKGGM